MCVQVCIFALCLYCTSHHLTCSTTLSVSCTHAQFSLQRYTNHLEMGEMPGWHFDMLFAADSFRIITSRLPWNFLISLLLIVSPALPGWGTTPHPHPPLLIPSSFSLLISLADLTAVVLNFLPGYFQRIHLVLLRVRGRWEQCSHRHQIFENKKTHLGKSGFVFLSVLGEAYIYCPRGYIVCVEAEKGSINNNDKQLNNNQHVNNNCVSLQVGNK